MKRATTVLAIWVFGMVQAFGLSVNTPSGVQEVFAGFVLNFLKFTDFSGERDEMVVAVIADDTEAAVFARVLNGQTAQGKIVRVVRAEPKGPTRRYSAVFVASGNANRFDKTVEWLRGAPVLLLSDSADSIDRGAMIGLFVSQNHVRFAVDRELVKAAGLGISSQVLRLASRVK